MKTKFLNQTFLLLICIILFNLSTCSSSCNNDPTPDEVEASHVVRAFFAEILQPPPELIETNVNPLKAAGLKYPRAIQIIASYPKLAEADPLLKTILTETDLTKAFAALKGKSQAKILIALKDYTDDAVFVENEAVLNDKINNFSFTNIPAINSINNIKIPDLGRSWSTFLKNILTNYFLALQLEDKKRILASLFTYTTFASSDADKLVAIIYGTGPFYQKYIQLFTDNIKADTDELVLLKNKLKSIKSGIPPINQYYINQYVAEINQNKTTQVEIGKILSSASTGGTYLANMTNQNTGDLPTRIVLKFLRPGIEEIADRELIFFRKEAENVSKNMLRSFNDLASEIYAELDYNLELEKLKTGYEVYDRVNTNVRVTKPISNFPPSGSWLAMELAPGKTFSETANSSYLAENLNAIESDPKIFLKYYTELMIKGKMIEVLTKVFIENTFFRIPNGFFHGDLHEGNVLLYIDPTIYDLAEKLLVDLISRKDYTITSVQLLIDDIIPLLIKEKDANNNPKIFITIIDFGNSYIVNGYDHRQGLLNVLIAATDPFTAAEGFMKAINLLLPQAEKIPDSQEGILARELSRLSAYKFGSNMQAFKRIGEGIDFLLSKNLVVPLEIMAISRSLALIYNAGFQVEETSAKINPYIYKVNFTDTILDALVCPVAKKSFPLFSGVIEKILRYLDVNTDNCVIDADLSLSRANMANIISNYTTGSL